MNRNEIESDPHSLLEGMAIGGLRHRRHAWHHLCPRRISAGRPPAERGARAGQELRLLGNNILDSGFDFDIELVEGAGAFVCGEETALIASLEGRPGRPAAAPALSRRRRACGATRPTSTTSRPGSISRRSSPRGRRGSARSAANEPRHQGLLAGRQGAATPAWSKCRSARRSAGSSMTPAAARARPQRQGGADRRSVRRLHPARHARHAGRFRALGQARLDHGVGRHGGDGRRQLHGRRRPLLHRIHRSEFCGKCTPCRVGLDKALRTLTRITKGEGREEDLAELDELGRMIRETSLCGLGHRPQLDPHGARHFRHEFEDHIREKRCHAGVCQDLAWRRARIAARCT